MPTRTATDGCVAMDEVSDAQSRSFSPPPTLKPDAAPPAQQLRHRHTHGDPAQHSMDDSHEVKLQLQHGGGNRRWGPANGVSGGAAGPSNAEPAERPPPHAGHEGPTRDTGRQRAATTALAAHWQSGGGGTADGGYSALPADGMRGGGAGRRRAGTTGRREAGSAAVVGSLNCDDEGRDAALGGADENLDAPLLDAAPSSSSIAGGRRRADSRASRGGSSTGSGDPDPDQSAALARAKELAKTIREGTWSLTAEVLDLIPNKVAERLLVPAIPPAILSRLHDFQEALLVPFSHDDPAHQRLIPLLWEQLQGVRGSLPMAGAMDAQTYRSELWKDYGFQGVDPGTDFRGAGLLGLRAIIWLCHEEPDLCSAMLDSGYPFAIAAINVVMSLMNVLHLTKGRKTCLETSMPNLNYTSQEARMRLAVIVGGWTNTPSLVLPAPPRGPEAGSELIAHIEDGFFTLTGEACRVLHATWLRSKRNVMEFNSVLKAATIRFEKLLRDKETYLSVSRAIDAKYPDVPLSCSGI